MALCPRLLAGAAWPECVGEAAVLATGPVGTASPNLFHRIRCTSNVSVPASSRPARFRHSCAGESATSSQADRAWLAEMLAVAGIVATEMNTPTSDGDFSDVIDNNAAVLGDRPLTQFRVGWWGRPGSAPGSSAPGRI